MAPKCVATQSVDMRKHIRVGRDCSRSLNRVVVDLLKGNEQEILFKSLSCLSDTWAKCEGDPAFTASYLGICGLQLLVHDCGWK